MTTDCLDTFAADTSRPVLDLSVTDRHLKIASLTAAGLVIFVLPIALAVASLFS
ncbi:MAG: hypothetical protein JF588_09820 [Caulobacterales bacterium]|nr:hypothetical protein [Caulobacterales bacterium]